MKTKEGIIKNSDKRSIIALVLCGVVIISVFIGVVTKLVAESTVLDPDEGIRSFRYFTVLSNMFVAFCASLCIPYEIDGLRNHNYHLPSWIVKLLYCGVCLVTVTFVIAVCLIAPIQGFKETLFLRASLFLHTICPISAMILFIFVNDDHNISFKYSFLILIPLFAYAFIYWLEVFVIGNWQDHYYANTYLPYWLSMLIVMLLGLLISYILSLLHNKQHQKHKQKAQDYYLCSEEYKCNNIEEAIIKLANREKVLDKGGEIIVPRRLIIILKKRYKSDIPLEELCYKYLVAYLEEK